MRKQLCLGLLAALILGARSLDAQRTDPNPGSLPAYSGLVREVFCSLVQAAYRENLQRYALPFFSHPEAEGGGDGGDGGSGTGGDGSAGGSDSGGNGSDASGSSGSASDSNGPSDNGDPDSDPAPSDVAPPATDPTDPTNMDAFSHQAYDAVANPFGGDFPTEVSPTGPGNTLIVSGAAAAEPGSPSGPGAPESGLPGGPGSAASPGGEPDVVPPPPPPPATSNASQPRAQIHAVIVSGLADPSQVLRGNVNLTCGIVALGTPDPTAPQTPGRWDPNVKITPDPELLNGHKIPPLVPNIIDVRIMHHEISATMESESSISGQPEPASNDAGPGGP